MYFKNLCLVKCQIVWKFSGLGVQGRPKQCHSVTGHGEVYKSSIKVCPSCERTDPYNLCNKGTSSRQSPLSLSPSNNQQKNAPKLENKALSYSMSYTWMALRFWKHWLINFKILFSGISSKSQFVWMKYMTLFVDVSVSWIDPYFWNVFRISKILIFINLLRFKFWQQCYEHHWLGAHTDRLTQR